jgi:hypothetical protein
MFENIFPGFLGFPTSYGPLFHLVAAQVAKLSLGNEKAALALFKALNLGLHAACSALVYRLSRAPVRKLSLALYAANPLILFGVLTCAHNDVMMVVFTLLCFVALEKRRPLAAGACIGFAISFKYVPLLFLPFVCVNLCLDRDSADPAAPKFRFRPAIRFLAGFATACAAAVAFYPQMVSAFLRLMRSNGSGVYRNSIFHLFSILGNLGMPVPDNADWWTFRVFLLGYAFLGLLHLLGALRGEKPDPIKAYFFSLTLYFVVTLQCIQEWYLLWILSLAFILKGRRFADFGLLLSCTFMPLVIFTVKIGNPMEFGVNAAVYVGVLLCTLELWVRSWRQSPGLYSLLRPSSPLRSPK